MKVRITKASKSDYWYVDRIGEIFEVENYDMKDYLITSNYIKKSDCKIIIEPSEIKEPKFEFELEIKNSIEWEKRDKYCVGGRTHCKHFLGRDLNKGIVCGLINKPKTELIYFEWCPWPLKQKPIEDKYEKAWEILFEKLHIDISDRRGLKHEWGAIDKEVKDEINTTWQKLFIESLKEAGL